ncbi:cellulase family glycosylhydrolase [candidate division KSB1 bacterium]|nr:cellulase family glycosylhydrolase [candidate division KSB1 bacterium]
MQRKILPIFILSFILFACGKEQENITEEPANGEPTLMWLSTAGNKIVDETSNAVILRGVNLPGLEWDKSGAGINESEVNYICQTWKVKIIRLPFNQDWILNDAGYYDLFDRVIGWIVNNGAYVLLDLQWQDTAVKIPPIPNEQAVDMWKMIANRYKNNPAVLYDIHNEAHDTSWQAWRNRASEIIEAIRSVHTKALIFVSGLDWAYDLRGWGTTPLPYAHIVYSSHPYPFKGEPWAWDKYFGDVATKLPVFIGEFGGGSQDLEWGRQLLTYMEQKDLGWTAWAWSASPFLVGNDRRTPTEFGQLVRNALLQDSDENPQYLKISDIQVLYIAQDRATVNWKTNVEADSKVRYGFTAAYGDSVYAPVMLTSHTIKLTGLLPSTTYHFQVVSQDNLGVRGISSDSTFVTAP